MAAILARKASLAAMVLLVGMVPPDGTELLALLGPPVLLVPLAAMVSTGVMDPTGVTVPMGVTALLALLALLVSLARPPNSRARASSHSSSASMRGTGFYCAQILGDLASSRFSSFFFSFALSSRSQ
jgi:hypothetical protein